MKSTVAVIVLSVFIHWHNVNAFAEEIRTENHILPMRAEQQVVRIAGDPYPPWTIGDVGSKPDGGIAVQIVEELFRRLSMSTTTFIYPFKRGLARIKNGEDDVILMVSRSKEREQFMFFSLPIRQVKFLLFYSDEMENFTWNDWKDLQPYTIGGVAGHNLGEDWENAVTNYQLRVEEVKTDIFNIEKLLRGRIDLFIADDEVLTKIIETNPRYQGRLKWHTKPIFESVNNLGVSKKSFLAPMLPEINEELRKMKEEGTFQRIFCAHGKSFKGRCDNN